jgi:ABC-type sugar transport system permease subunit
MVFEIPMILIFSLFMAVVLNQKMAGRAVFRAIFFLPVILSTGLMASIGLQNDLGTSMESGVSDGSGGNAANEIVSVMDFKLLFENMAIGKELLDYVVTAINNIYDIVNRSGVQLLIFLAGLQSISPAIYESVKVDGATGWETFWKITFPMISPMILVNAVYTVIDSFTRTTNPAMEFIARLQTGDPHKATAMSWMYFLVVVIVILVVAGIASSFIFYQRRD